MRVSAMLTAYAMQLMDRVFILHKADLHAR